MTTSRVAVRFVVSTYEADAEGRVPCVEPTLLDEEVLERLAARPLASTMGGFVFVVEDRVWNGYAPTRFVPEGLSLPVDHLAFAALFLEDWAAGSGATDVDCATAEVTALRVRVDPDGTVALTWIDDQGQTLAGPTRVALDGFQRELLRATRDAVGFAERRIAWAGEREPDRAFAERLKRALAGLEEAARRPRA